MAIPSFSYWAIDPCAWRIQLGQCSTEWFCLWAALGLRCIFRVDDEMLTPYKSIVEGTRLLFFLEMRFGDFHSVCFWQGLKPWPLLLHGIVSGLHGLIVQAAA